MILISKYLVPKGYNSISIYPIFIIRTKDLKTDKILLNHKRIHLVQQLECLVILFYLFYVLEFIWLLLKYRRWHVACRQISFEKEAYQNKKDLDYLKSRSLWNFAKYL